MSKVACRCALKMTFYEYMSILELSYCEVVLVSSYDSGYILLASAFICLIVMVASYAQIYASVRKQPNPAMDSHRTVLYTSLFIVGSFIICWMPLCIYNIIVIIWVHVDVDSVLDAHNFFRNIDRHLFNLLMINSLVDPIIYSTRLKEVQLGFKQLFQRCSYLCNPRAVLPSDDPTVLNDAMVSRAGCQLMQAPGSTMCSTGSTCRMLKGREWGNCVRYMNTAYG